jgi:hypothetical protein
MCCDSKRNLLTGKDLLQRLYITSLCTQYLKCTAAHLVYLHADLSLKEKILAKSRSSRNERLCRYKPDDELMSFLKSL